jgi:hypothetical protein
MTSTRKKQPPTFGFRDLTVWSTKLPDVKFGVLPPSNNRPNPLATQDRLYVSVFAPGAICALDRDRGKLLWRRDLLKYADASVHLHEGKSFAKTSNTLFAFCPDSGETLWSFCPHGTDGESIYSSPSTDENRVYIGDRKGYLHFGRRKRQDNLETTDEQSSQRRCQFHTSPDAWLGDNFNECQNRRCIRSPVGEIGMEARIGRPFDLWAARPPRLCPSRLRFAVLTQSKEWNSSTTFLME